MKALPILYFVLDILLYGVFSIYCFPSERMVTHTLVERKRWHDIIPHFSQNLEIFHVFSSVISRILDLSYLRKTT
jgi:hypothetical protein